jgi:hypothetical protein
LWENVLFLDVMGLDENATQGKRLLLVQYRRANNPPPIGFWKTRR